MEFIEHNSLYVVRHEKYESGGRWELGETIVEAKSRQDAMDKLNTYLATNPDGVYTSELCEDVDDVSELIFLK